MPTPFTLRVNITFFHINQWLTGSHDLLLSREKLFSQLLWKEVKVRFINAPSWCHHAQIAPVLNVVDDNTALDILEVDGIRHIVDYRPQQVAFGVDGALDLLALNGGGA